MTTKEQFHRSAREIAITGPYSKIDALEGTEEEYYCVTILFPGDDPYYNENHSTECPSEEDAWEYARQLSGKRKIFNINKY